MLKQHVELQSQLKNCLIEVLEHVVAILVYVLLTKKSRPNLFLQNCNLAFTA